MVKKKSKGAKRLEFTGVAKKSAATPSKNALIPSDENTSTSSSTLDTESRPNRSVFRRLKDIITSTPRNNDAIAPSTSLEARSNDTILPSTSMKERLKNFPNLELSTVSSDPPVRTRAQRRKRITKKMHILQKKPIYRIIKHTLIQARNMCPNSQFIPLHISLNAFLMIHQAVELFTIRFIELACRLARHSKRVTLL